MNLYQASRWFFKRSEKCMKLSLILSGLLLVLTVIGLTHLNQIWETILILGVAAIQVWQMWMKYRSLYWFGKGDEPRRMDQFRSGLGLEPSRERCAAIEIITGECNDPIRNDYWCSIKPAGPVRMTEMILESSFSTRYYARKCLVRFWAIGVIGLVLCIAAIVIAFQLREVEKTSDLTSHIIITIFIFFLTGDFWILGSQYKDLRSSANDSHLQASGLLEAGVQISETQALELAMSYNTAVAQAPPLLSGLYKKHQPEVDMIFKRHYADLLGV
jgi:hypothetical protein